MIAENIRRLRERNGVTQKALADAIHVSKSSVCQYESGNTRPSRETLALIADYFHVSVAYIEGESKIAELEELMNQKYSGDLTVRELVGLCMRLTPDDRLHAVRVIECLARDHGNRR